MNKNAVIKNILTYSEKIGMWRIEINNITDANFVLGYGFDKNANEWKVYQNGDKGVKNEWKFENEEDALEKLYKKVRFQYKITSE